jgi:hypothetical protein
MGRGKGDGTPSARQGAGAAACNRLDLPEAWPVAAAKLVRAERAPKETAAHAEARAARLQT